LVACPSGSDPVPLIVRWLLLIDPRYSSSKILHEHNIAVTCINLKRDANEPLQTGLAGSHAAAVKHTVITIEKAIGRIKRYLQLTTVMAAKLRARAHTVTRITAKVSALRPPSCRANTAANR
jgi:hypothetical protein